MGRIQNDSMLANKLSINNTILSVDHAEHKIREIEPYSDGNSEYVIIKTRQGAHFMLFSTQEIQIRENPNDKM
jgi:hypothetical protein